jgi:2-polyprenyl-3-methyl-5-hydroxy-6-metoxy-1,4-benzoquinol methylase
MLNDHSCIVCGSKTISPFLSVKDFTVSGLNFDLGKCEQCGFVFTLSPPAMIEIGKFYKSDAYISHTNSNAGLFNKIYRLIRSYTLASKKRLITRFSKVYGGLILDYGCGTGAFIKHMKNSGWKVEGIEQDDDARSTATMLTGQLILKPSDLTEFETSKFDIITLWHVLEHIHDIDYVLSQFNRIIGKSGKLIIAVPNHLSYDAAHYQSHWAAYDVPRHLHHFNPSTIRTLLNKYGFELHSIKPMWFDSFYVSLLSEKYRGGRMRTLSAIWVGFISNLKAIINPGTCSSQIYVFRKKIQ